MSWQLTDVEVRVLGALIEKDMATPEYYPLSLNALVNACNQKSNRDPVVQYDENAVSAAIEKLQGRQLAAVLTGRDHRVPKYRHWAWETLSLGRREMALLGVLMLRGPQTVGELKERTHRLYVFDDLASVESCLKKMIDRKPEPLMVQLARRPGSREPRYAHLLCGDVPAEPTEAPLAQSPPSVSATERHDVKALQSRIAELEQQIETLTLEFAEFRRKLE